MVERDYLREVEDLTEKKYQELLGKKISKHAKNMRKASKVIKPGDKVFKDIERWQRDMGYTSGMGSSPATSLRVALRDFTKYANEGDVNKALYVLNHLEKENGYMKSEGLVDRKSIKARLVRAYEIGLEKDPAATMVYRERVEAFLKKNSPEGRRQINLADKVRYLSVLSLLGSIFFLSSNVTGNAIAGYNISTANISGIILLILALIFGGLYLKNRKKKELPVVSNKKKKVSKKKR